MDSDEVSEASETMSNECPEGDYSKKDIGVKRIRLNSDVSIISSGSMYSHLSHGPPSSGVPDTREHYQTTARCSAVERDNSKQRIQETLEITSDLCWVRIEKCVISTLLRRSVSHHSDVVDWITTSVPPAESMILHGFREHTGDVTILDGNARLSGMRRANDLSDAEGKDTTYDKVHVRLFNCGSVNEAALSILRLDAASPYMMSEKISHLKIAFDSLSIDVTMNYQAIAKMINKLLPEEVYSVRVVRMALCPDDVIMACCELMHDQNIGLKQFDCFHLASGVNRAEAFEALLNFTQQKDLSCFINECRRLSNSVASYLRSLPVGYDYYESEEIEKGVKEIPIALTLLRCKMRAQRWVKKKAADVVVSSIQDLWTAEKEKAREIKGLLVEIGLIGEKKHDMYILPLKVAFDQNGKRRRLQPKLSIEQAEFVTDGVILFVGDEEGEMETYCGEEILLMTRDSVTKGSLTRNFIKCRVVIRKNSTTYNKKETVQFLDSRGFKAINTYETFASSFKSVELFLGTTFSQALDFVGPFIGLLKTITVEDEEDRATIEAELKTLEWAKKNKK